MLLNLLLAKKSMTVFITNILLVSTTTKIHICQETTEAFILFNATEFTKQTAEHQSNLAVNRLCQFAQVCQLVVCPGFSLLPVFLDCCHQLLSAGFAFGVVHIPPLANQHLLPQPISWLSFPCVNSKAKQAFVLQQ